MKGGTRTGTRLASVIGPYALAGVFLLAALTKLRDLTGLYQVLESSLGIPTSVVYPLGQFVVAAEILVVLALVLPHYRTLGFIGAGILSAAFLAFSAYRLLKDQTSPCHCFGDLIHLSPLQSCGLNVVILFASCWMLVVRLKASRDGRTSNPDAQFLAGFLAILGSASVAIYINR